jgi:hypothetical protein
MPATIVAKTPSQPAAVGGRSLWPREHGAYVQLAAPLVAAFLANGVTIASLLFAIGGCLAFIANEPLLVILGNRGHRMHQHDGKRARHRLFVFVPLAVMSGIGGFALGSADVRASAALVAVPAILVVILAWRRRVHSLFGELVAVTVLTGVAVPSAVAAGLPLQDALLVWGAWTCGYASTVIGVHRVLARHRHRRRATRRDRVIGLCMVGLTLVVIASGFVTPCGLAALPLVACSTALVLWPPPATRLRAIGFGLVAASLLSVAVVVACGGG